MADAESHAATDRPDDEATQGADDGAPRDTSSQKATGQDEVPHDAHDPHDRPEPAEATHAGEDEAWGPPADEAGVLRAQVEALEARVAALDRDVQTERDRHLRARADYENLRRRSEAEREERDRLAAARLVERLLEPLEALALAAADAEATGAANAQGVRLAHRTLQAVLEREGLAPVPGEGEPFDPRHHEAVAREPHDLPSGTVIGVVRPGYLLHGRLLRAALVRVSEGPAAATTAQ